MSNHAHACLPMPAAKEDDGAPVSAAVRFHDDLADRWGENYQKPSFGRRAEMLFELVEQAAGQPGRWLDAGCGAGVLSLGLAERGHQVIGVDASAGMIRAAEEVARKSRAAGVSFRQIESVETLPWPNETFDGVLCSSVIEYLDEPDRCLDEVARVLKPGGVAVISVPNRTGLLRRLQKCSYAVTSVVCSEARPRYLQHSRNEFSAKSFHAALRNIPLSPLVTRYYGARLPNWLSKRPLGGSLLMVSARK